MMQRSLRKFVSATVLFLPLISLNPKVALADQRDFNLINDSKLTINEVYVSTINTDQWEEDVLGQETLDSGKSTEITFSRGAAGTCVYDIKVVTTQSQEVERRNVNLCETNDVIFNGSSLTLR
ncbi:MAG: hypothetical protein WBV73_10905 [Phormidium sp.]